MWTTLCHGVIYTKEQSVFAFYVSGMIHGSPCFMSLNHFQMNVWASHILLDKYIFIAMLYKPCGFREASAWSNLNSVWSDIYLFKCWKIGGTKSQLFLVTPLNRGSSWFILRFGGQKQLYSTLLKIFIVLLHIAPAFTVSHSHRPPIHPLVRSQVWWRWQRGSVLSTALWAAEVNCPSVRHDGQQRRHPILSQMFLYFPQIHPVRLFHHLLGE